MKTRFSVQMDCLRQSEETLQRCYRLLNNTIDELEAVRRRIASTMSVDDCVTSLAKAQSNLEEHMIVLWQMAKALERAAESYNEAEHRLICSCEGVMKIEWTKTFGVNDFTYYKQEMMKLNLF